MKRMSFMDVVTVLVTFFFLVALAAFWHFQPDGTRIEPEKVARQ